MKAIQHWLNQRTGLGRLVQTVLYDPIPGGARWRYVWGSTLLFGLIIQGLTGMVLWMAYSPSSHTAWESVHYIQTQLYGGWLIRGIHYYTAEVLVVLLVLHFMQILIDGAYRAPREFNFWLGLGLMFLVLAEALTGYMLPWDERAFQAVRVDTSLLALTPLVGSHLQRLVVGGADYGHHTLTRLFAMHAGLFPAAIFLFGAGRLWLFYRHGRAARQPHLRDSDTYWPGQAWRDALACLAVLAAVLALALRMHGAALGAPADPAEPYAAARPAWYLMFLYHFLKFFPGPSEVWGAILIPGLVVFFILLMPLLGRWRLGHWFNLGVAGAVFCGILLLTWLALARDRHDQAYQLARRAAAQHAARAALLAASPGGIPVEGALTLLRHDPLTQGPKLFARHCSSCHRYDGHDGRGHVPAEPPSAPDLKDFGTARWITGLLDPDQIGQTHYFGGTKFAEGKMARFVKSDVAQYDTQQKERLAKVVSALSAEAGRTPQTTEDPNASTALAEGRKWLQDESMRCTECHDFHGVNADPVAPTLTGYASREWMFSFVSNPNQEQYYGRRNDRMPAFGEQQILSAEAIGLVVDWLRGDYYQPGMPPNPIASPAKTLEAEKTAPDLRN